MEPNLKGDTVDAYVEIYLNEVKETSRVMYGQVNPVWRQFFNLYFNSK